MQHHWRATVLTLATVLAMGAGCGGGGDKASTGGVYAAADSGNTWEARQLLLTSAGAATISTVDVLAFARDPQDASAVYLGTRAHGLFLSLDGGTSWQRPREERARSGGILAIAVDPSNVCTYYVLKAERLLKTTTCGRVFDVETYVEQSGEEQLTVLAVDPADSRNIWVGSTAGDVTRSWDGGATWTTVNRSRDAIRSILVSNADHNVVLVGTTRSGVLRSADGGTTWVDMEDALNDYTRADRVLGFSQTTDGGTILMATAYGLFISKDIGLTWSPIATVTEGGEVPISAFAIAPSDGNVIYYGTTGGFNVSVNGGQSWALEDLPTSRAASAILVDPRRPSSVLLGVQSIEE